MALSPHNEKIWWKELIAHDVSLWTAVTLLWGIIMSVIVSYWRV